MSNSKNKGAAILTASSELHAVAKLTEEQKKELEEELSVADPTVQANLMDLADMYDKDDPDDVAPK